jgi:hypothetical protein
MALWEPWTQKSYWRPYRLSKTRWMRYLTSTWVFNAWRFVRGIAMASTARNIVDDWVIDILYLCPVDWELWESDQWVLDRLTVHSSALDPSISRSTPTSSPMEWSTRPSCFCLKIPFDCLRPTMKALSICWVSASAFQLSRVSVLPKPSPYCCHHYHWVLMQRHLWCIDTFAPCRT